MRCRRIASIVLLAWMGACTLAFPTDDLSSPDLIVADGGPDDVAADVPPDAAPDADPGACGDSCPPPPPLATSCSGGGVGIANDCAKSADCCTTTLVPGGSFLRSNDPSSPATVSAYYLDRFEITVGRYRRFVDAGKGTQASPPANGSGAHPKIPGSGWLASYNALLPADSTALRSALKCDAVEASWTDAPGAGESRPIGCIDWVDAFAFCAWDGGRLPTEAEWNFAAAGGIEQRYFPWSVPGPSKVRDSTYAVYGCRATYDGGKCSPSDLPAAGSRSPKGDGRWGHADLSGSMNEWMLDWYAGYAPVCTDCANLSPASYHVKRGEEWRYAVFLDTVGRDHDAPTLRVAGGGIRCAR